LFSGKWASIEDNYDDEIYERRDILRDSSHKTSSKSLCCARLFQPTKLVTLIKMETLFIAHFFPTHRGSCKFFMCPQHNMYLSSLSSPSFLDYDNDENDVVVERRNVCILKAHVASHHSSDKEFHTSIRIYFWTAESMLYPLVNNNTNGLCRVHGEEWKNFGHKIFSTEVKNHRCQQLPSMGHKRNEMYYDGVLAIWHARFSFLQLDVLLMHSFFAHLCHLPWLEMEF
jgi:hypothetical protein